MTPTNHITRAQARIARIEDLASRDARHLQQIVTPARTGGRIGRNRRKPATPSWASVITTIIGVALFAAAIGLLAGMALR